MTQAWQLWLRSLRAEWKKSEWGRAIFSKLAFKAADLVASSACSLLEIPLWPGIQPKVIAPLNLSSVASRFLISKVKLDLMGLGHDEATLWRTLSESEKITAFKKSFFSMKPKVYRIAMASIEKIDAKLDILYKREKLIEGQTKAQPVDMSDSDLETSVKNSIKSLFFWSTNSLKRSFGAGQPWASLSKSISTWGTKRWSSYGNSKKGWTNALLTWCLKPCTLTKALRKTNVSLMLMPTMIGSCIDYGSHIFSLQNHKFFDKLEKVRNQALRLALGYRNNTLINVMLAETCQPPSKIRFVHLAKKYVLKSFVSKVGPNFSGQECQIALHN